MEQQTHFFFAVRIPEETKSTMKNHIEKLRIELPFQRWVHHEDLHITLAFLGSATTEKLEQAKKNIHDAINASKSFRLQINRIGIFGKEEAPRVFWADTVESDALKSLRNQVFSACEQAGFKLETRPFRPHITLARKWKGAEPFNRTQMEIWDRLQPKPLEFQANEVVLYQTHLQRTPKYEAVAVLPLKEES